MTDIPNFDMKTQEGRNAYWQERNTGKGMPALIHSSYVFQLIEYCDELEEKIKKLEKGYDLKITAFGGNND